VKSLVIEVSQCFLLGGFIGFLFPANSKWDGHGTTMLTEYIVRHVEVNSIPAVSSQFPHGKAGSPSCVVNREMTASRKSKNIKKKQTYQQIVARLEH